MAWTSMTSGTYTMYITFSDDNPFDNANFGSISSYSLAIEVAAWQTFIITNLLGLLLLIML